MLQSRLPSHPHALQWIRTLRIIMRCACTSTTNGSDLVQVRCIQDRFDIHGTFTCTACTRLSTTSQRRMADELLAVRNRCTANQTFFAEDGFLSKVDKTLVLPVHTEVHKTRFMPQNPYVVAMKSQLAEVDVYSLQKHSNLRKVTKDVHVCTLEGHKTGGWALEWDHIKEGTIISGSADGLVLEFSIEELISAPRHNKLYPSCKPLNRYTQPTKGIEDVSLKKDNSNIIAAACEDSIVYMWDRRQGPGRCSLTLNAHTTGVTCVDFNPIRFDLFATGGDDNSTHVWDMRNTSTPYQTLDSHQGSTGGKVDKVSWAPFGSGNYLASSGGTKIFIWDIDVPKGTRTDSRLVFMHCGHEHPVTDFDWHPDPNHQWTIASCDYDNVTQIWKVNPALTHVDPEELAKADKVLWDNLASAYGTNPTSVDEEEEEKEGVRQPVEKRLRVK